MTQERQPDVNANDVDFDNFLDAATHAVKDLWYNSKGRQLTIDELYAINDALTAIFSAHRLG